MLILARKRLGALTVKADVTYNLLLDSAGPVTVYCMGPLSLSNHNRGCRLAQIYQALQCAPFQKSDL